ncbi:linear amide C-N hydrolase [Hydrogenovibrio thermophilus]|jgi:choloylglycine hydrolase|uniref:Linear amide C-N hydrolase n=1 Tax=Hydrogenovibrio thermophilus TaxID=265883 RepID=A0A410H405_9GAMM|nr:linear amide C-N hydrolase [Hydrogenovibrio thermophilus]QAB15668.1 linear amide C-N hydrolase [Hydrogenovibrio thermophilus]
MKKTSVTLIPLLTISLAATTFALTNTAQACTSLLYKDANGAPYAGRTMELPMELAYQVSYFPKGSGFTSKIKDHPDLSYQSKYPFIAITVPDPLDKTLKVSEGMNDQGLTFSLLAFASTKGPADTIKKTKSILAAIDLGAWTLSQFKNVSEVKAALKKQPVLVSALLPLGLMKTPFHYTLHDAQGQSVVIEFANGKQTIIDNPIGVMTNGPKFDWHMTNLNNYTFLNNIDQSKTTFHGVEFNQPDSGIATAGLPASNTSVGRFVRAVYYSQFAEKVDKPDAAMTTLAHIMNNFDRPRGVTMDERFKEEIANITAPEVAGHPLYTSEYTSWTALGDLRNLQFKIKPYSQLNYISFDLAKLAKEKQPKSIPLSQMPFNVNDVTDWFRKASAKNHQAW